MGAGHSAGRRNFDADADADADAGAGGEDLLSALPDDVFVSILLKLRDAAAAARTSVLARRWRCLWALVPELAFADGIQHHRIIAALAAHEALDLRDLQVVTREASVEYLAVHRRSPPLWLHAPQGGVARGRGRGPGRAGARTERGHSASLLPASHLRRTRVLVSSPRPAAIRGVRPAPSSHAGRHSRLRPVQPRRRCLLPAVPILKGSLCPECPWTGQLQNPFQVIGNHKYLMEDMTRLPDVEYLTLDVISCGHSFGASSFHVLRMCSRFTILKIRFSCQLQAQTGCSSGCICDQPPNWKTEELRLIWLEDVQILSFAGTEHEVAFLKRLFSWATALKRMMVTFHGSITESKGKELRQLLLSFSRPEICICILPSSAPS